MLDPVNLGVWLISSLQLGSKDCPQVRWPEGKHSCRQAGRWEGLSRGITVMAA